MKEKDKIIIMKVLCIISLIVTVISIQKTYARYFEKVDTTYNTNIKRWLIKVNDNIIHNSETLNEVMEPIITKNENVTNNVLVPGQTGYFEMLIDYTYVDLAFEYEFSIEQLNETALEDFEIYGYEIIDGDNHTITETKEIKGIIDPINEKDSAGERKRKIRVLFRWNDAEGSIMDNKADTQFRGEENNIAGENTTSENALRTILKYKATMKFTQHIPEEDETTTT